MYARPINWWYALQKPWFDAALCLYAHHFFHSYYWDIMTYFMWFGSNLLDWNINGIIIVENNLLLSEFHNTIHNLNWIVFNGREMANHSIRTSWWIAWMYTEHEPSSILWFDITSWDYQLMKGPVLLRVVLRCKVSRQLLVHLLHLCARSWCDPIMFSFSSTWASWVRWGLYILSMSAKDWKACTTG